MTLTAGRPHPAVMAALIRALTRSELERAVGGASNLGQLFLCRELGIHDFVFTGKYRYEEHPLFGFVRESVYRCPKCGQLTFRDREWIAGAKENEF